MPGIYFSGAARPKVVTVRATEGGLRAIFLLLYAEWPVRWNLNVGTRLCQTSQGTVGEMFFTTPRREAGRETETKRIDLGAETLPLLARLRHAGALWACPLGGVDRK
jgi:hypothetical protein